MLHSLGSRSSKELTADWIYRAEYSGLAEFKDCTRALHNWGKFILNSFGYSYIDSFTEGRNNKTKVLKRACYGVSDFMRFRNRILHCAA